jgi:hypothetical protein
MYKLGVWSDLCVNLQFEKILFRELQDIAGVENGPTSKHVVHHGSM